MGLSSRARGLLTAGAVRLNRHWEVQRRLEAGRANDELVRTIRREYARAESMKSADLQAVYQFALFMSLAERDLGHLSIFALRGTPGSDPHSESLVARLMAMHLYEVWIKVPHLNAKLRPLAEALVKREVLPKEFVERVGQLGRTATRLRERHQHDLYRWRNEAAAHRDFDAFVQLSAVEEVDLLTVMNVAAEFHPLAQEAIALSTELLEATGTTRGAFEVLRRAPGSALHEQD